jgi:hypothetical protein
VLAATALLWPSRLAGPLDGMPLDGRLEALLIGLALPLVFAIDRGIFKRAPVRGLIIALLVWKASLAAIAVPDGWCVRFTSPVPLFVENVTVPHAWDVRADWRSEVPRCSAVMTRAYEQIDRFPVWFYNLPPSNWTSPAREDERPPYARLAVRVTGSLRTATDGVFRVDTGETSGFSGEIDGRSIAATDLANGVTLGAGAHEISLEGQMDGAEWRLVPTWNGADVWHGAVATMSPARGIDSWLRPWGAWTQSLLVLALLSTTVLFVARRIHDARALTSVAAAGVAPIVFAGNAMVMRALPAALALAASLKLDRRLRNLFGVQLLIGVPFLILIAVRGYHDIGRAFWYTSGDDWWMFQRYAYRIYLQGFWLEGGETVLWFQPFYRWIAGALHLVFGDSSVGELFWDGGCALAGALFAFHVTRVSAGFRAGVLAAALTLALFTLGPGWYLFGRGLSEITSAGLIYSAALFAIRGRYSTRWVLAAGLCLSLGFLTRLNNLPFALAVAAFSLPIAQPAGDWWRWRTWWPRCAGRVLAGTIGAVAVAVILLGVRTYYFTGSVNPLAGTQASARSVWQESDAGETPLENATNSVLLMITMSDPPRLEPRAIPLVIGILAALLGLAGVGRFKQLPMNAALLSIAGIAGAFVARGSAYPGRFSIHLIPVTVALTICTVSLWFKPARLSDPADRPGRAPRQPPRR